MHPRNRHRAGYDFAALVRSSPTLKPFVGPNAYGDVSIDFANPTAVLALNQALLKTDYDVAHWDVPPGYLCPPIPGRADYLHLLADLIKEDNKSTIPRGPAVAILDIGVGANCIYPLIGVREYGWRFVGTESDPVALRHAHQIVAHNPTLAGLVELRAQKSPTSIFRAVVTPGEKFAACICNPPYHGSAEEAAAGTQRKLRNLGQARTKEPVRNFGGQPTELWCRGGEVAFIRRMINESALLPRVCRWFTTLVSKSEHLPEIEHTLTRLRATDVRIIPMAQGQKQSRIIAWQFSRETRFGKMARTLS